MEPFTISPQENRQSRFMQTNISGHNSQPESWVYSPSLTSGITNSSNIGLLLQTPISMKTTPPVVPNTPRLTSIQPSKEGFIPSSDSKWRPIMYGSLSPQQSLVQRPDIKQYNKQGCRDGCLKAETAKHAREMRWHGSCWQCRFSKVTVSSTHEF